MADTASACLNPFKFSIAYALALRWAVQASVPATAALPHTVPSGRREKIKQESVYIAFLLLAASTPSRSSQRREAGGDRDAMTTAARNP